MNRCVLTGRITKDVEIKYTQSGIANVIFTLAVNRPFKDANGQAQADFINCVAWRQQAEFLSNYVKKGYMLAVEGQIQTRSYENAQGQTVYITEVVCDRVENLQPRKTTQEQPTPTYNEYEAFEDDLPF